MTEDHQVNGIGPKQKLRPLARTVTKLERDGMPIEEIAWRLRRSPGHIVRVLEWSQLSRPQVLLSSGADPVLRPIERRVLRARSEGVDRAETAARLRRSPQHIANIERYADAKLASQH
jgi:DNA-binding CsgD family transcriptional regulator